MYSSQLLKLMESLIQDSKNSQPAKPNLKAHCTQASSAILDFNINSINGGLMTCKLIQLSFCRYAVIKTKQATKLK